MKEKIFSLADKILSLFPLSWETRRKISNFANLFFLTLKEGSKHTIRCDILFKNSLSFVENYLFKKDSNEKILNLKRNLDPDSQNLIDKIIKRQEYIFTHSILDDRLIFDAGELKEQRLIHFLRRNKNTYSSMRLCPESFYYHNGLKILPKEVLATLKDKDVIDGGAYIGDSAVIFSEEYSFGKIYSFEPDRYSYVKLKENIAKYKMKNVIPVNKGIASEEGKVNFEIQGLSSAISLEGSEEIEVTTVDKFVESSGPDVAVGLIKFDIEGFEFDGMIGSLDTIKKFRPVLLISIYHTGKDFFDIKPYLENLNLGYKFMIRKINPYNPIIETMLIAYVAD
jgi:FkbM family methyltransferase